MAVKCLSRRVGGDDGPPRPMMEQIGGRPALLSPSEGWDGTHPDRGGGGDMQGSSPAYGEAALHMSDISLERGADGKSIL